MSILRRCARSADSQPLLGAVDDVVGLPSPLASYARSSVFGKDAYTSLEHKAAALLHSLVRNPALVDGNKRLGWLATAVFLDINGRPPDLTDDEAFDLVMAVADGTLDVDAIAERLASE